MTYTKHKRILLTLFCFALSLGINQALASQCYNLSYYHSYNKNVSSQNILQESFSEMPSSNSLGSKNGTYWFRLDIDTSDSPNDVVAYIPTHNIDYIKLYRLINGKLQYLSKSGNIVTKEKPALDYKFPIFKINQKDIGKTYFMKVRFPKEANFPLKIMNENDFFKQALFNQSIIFLYYGTCLMIFLINLIYYFKFRNNIFLYYSLFLLSMTGGMLLYDGSLIGLQSIIPFGQHFEFIFRLMQCVTLILFSRNFLDLKYKKTTFIKWTFAFPLAIILGYLLYSITNNYLYIAVGDVVAISVFIIFWLLGLYYWKELVYAKFFVLGYLLILPVGAFYFVGYGFGLWQIDGENIIVKIAGWFDMIVFTFALIYRMKIKDNESIEIINVLKIRLDEMKETLAVKSKDVDPYFIFLKQNNFSLEPLTIREIEILKCLNEGFTNTQISDTLFISTNTVKTHVRNIYNKLDITNRVQLKEKVSEII